MAQFEVTFRDRSVERVGDADAYQQEGPMTTFFRTEGRATVDSWSTRVASVRTADVLLIRRGEEATTVNGVRRELRCASDVGGGATLAAI